MRDMAKRHLVFLLLMVMAVATASSSTWKIHNYYVAGKIQNVFDTGDKVYYLNSDRLFQFDKATLTTVSLNRQNKLSDNQISQIYYDWENRLLFVAYANSNIDVIDASGKVTNINGIKDVVMEVHDFTLNKGELSDYVGKEIRDITFAEGKAYVAMGYGYAVIDETTLTVIRDVEVRNTVAINAVAKIGQYLVIISDSYTYYGDPEADDPINTYAKRSGSFAGAKLYPIDDHSAFLMTQSKLLYYDFAPGTPTATTLVSAAPTCVQKTPNGFIANFAGQSYYYTIDATGKTATKHGSAEGFASSDPNGGGTVWINDANGLHIDGSTDYYKINSLMTDAPYWLKYNASMNLLYAGNSGPISLIYNPPTDMAFVVNTYDGVQWSNATAYNVPDGAYAFQFHPLDPTTYVRASWNKGIHKVTNNVLKTTYTKTNAPINGTKPTPAFDNYGNLWVVSSYLSSSEVGSVPPVAVLPAAKFAKASVVKSDWIVPNGLSSLHTGKMQRARFLVCKKNNLKIYTDGDYLTQQGTGNIFCWDNGAEDPSVDNYRIVKLTRFIDQDDRQVEWTYINHMELDNDDNVWVCHNKGVFMFDPDGVFDEQPRALRPFVTRSSEGKGILCEGYSVYDLGVDRNNNKWLATDDGVYYVSPDGSEILSHFTSDNSDLPSNMVYSVECDTVNGCVYVYTDNGFAEYVALGDAAALSFDNAYVYPNPVEPDFTGFIKIAGLMEDSYITITDRDGRVVTQLGPVMGGVLWDGCDSDGHYVPTGTYNIYAAQGSQPVVDENALLKLLIIR